MHGFLQQVLARHVDLSVVLVHGFRVRGVFRGGPLPVIQHIAVSLLGFLQDRLYVEIVLHHFHMGLPIVEVIHVEEFLVEFLLDGTELESIVLVGCLHD